jgi:antitoxin PrlF
MNAFPGRFIMARALSGSKAKKTVSKQDVGRSAAPKSAGKPTAAQKIAAKGPTAAKSQATARIDKGALPITFNKVPGKARKSTGRYDRSLSRNDFFASTLADEIVVEEVSTITSKNQTTVPELIRRQLQAGKSHQLLWSVTASGVIVVNKVKADRQPEEHFDPAIGGFLRLLENDIAAGRNLHDSNDLFDEALKLVKGVTFDLDAPLPKQ